MVELVYKAWHNLPSGQAKRYVRRVLGLVFPHSLSRRMTLSYPMVVELNKLDIRAAAITPDGVPFISLANGTTFYGYLPTPTQKATYAVLPLSVRRRFPESCFRVAMDIVCRYVYPHAVPSLTPPYRLAERACFHRQHQDTIDDIPGLTTEQRTALRRQFVLNPGDVILDVGGYIGFGALALARLVGPQGQVVSFEVDSANQAMFVRNIQENGSTNVRLMRHAIWSGAGELELYCKSFQANSLIAGIVRANREETVPAECIDNVVRDQHLAKVSLISLTINGAEVEALQGMDNTLRSFSPNFLIAGWYYRDGIPVHEHATRFLHNYGYQTIVGRAGRVYAWKLRHL
jgi:FkbM family methyltransferase